MKEEQEENLFSDFKASFFGQPIPKTIQKDKPANEKPTNDGEELTDEEIQALDKLATDKTSSKEKEKKEVPKEEVEETSDLNEDPENLNLFIEFARHLNDEGIVDLKEDDKIETDEDLLNIVKRQVKTGVEQYKASKSEDVQKFLEFVDNGGNPSDFHKYYYGNASFENFDIENEDNQKYVIEQVLKLEGYTDEEITEEINDASDLGKLDKKASTALKKLQKIEGDNKKMLVEAQKAYAAKQEAENEEKWNNFKKGLFDREEISGFKFTPKMKNDVWEYMTKPISRKDQRTQYQVDIDENPDSRYIFAMLMKNKWNVESLSNQIQTKEVGKFKEKLNKYSDQLTKKTKSFQPKREKEQESDFSAFKEYLK